MNYTTKLGIAGLILASGVAFAAEPEQGWYVGLLGNVNYAPNVKFTFTNPFTSVRTQGNLKYGIGGGGGLQLGYRCGYFRYEGELIYETNGYDTISANPPFARLAAIQTDIRKKRKSRNPLLSLDGKTSLFGGLVNAYYEFYEDGTAPDWVPYVGLGIGYAAIQNSLHIYCTNPALGCNTTSINTKRNSANDSSVLAQAIAGINYMFSETTSLGTDLRYMTTKKIEPYEHRYSNGSLNFVLNYSFDQPRY